MFDNFYTKYEDVQEFISEANAKDIIEKLEGDLKSRKMTAEKYAYLSKAYIFNQDNKKALKYAKEAIKHDKKYAYGYIRLAFAYAREGNKKEDMNYADDSDFFIYKSVPSRSSRLLKKISDSCSFRSDFLTLFQHIFLLQRSIWSILHLKNHGTTLQYLQCMPLIFGNMNAIIS